MTWWQGQPMRLLQTNLREIDLPLDPAAYARGVADLGANVALFNLGGIVANYPTRLPFHYHNPRITADFIPDLIAELHGRGIRFIGRFDFSKVNEAIGRDHPEWLYLSLRGEPITYNGQMHCCVNGAYQQRHALEILAEALELYPLDGVFFNMIGYQTHDYSGNYHGPCQCANCRARFAEFCGADLPTREDPTDPVYQHYLRFCAETSRELFLRIRDGIKARRSDCAICTYISDGIDIVRSESNSGIRRAQPEFVYDASLNVRRVHGSWPGLAASNAAVHFVDYPYRHAGVSPALTARRLAQDFIHGGWLDYYVIGKLDEQQDRVCQPEVSRLFHLHQQAESWLADAKPLADACVIKASESNPARNWDELRGLITLLSEGHILYDVIEESALADTAAELDSKAQKPAAIGSSPIELAMRISSYPLVIVPDIPNLSPALASALQEYVRLGGRLLLTGRSCLAGRNPVGALPCAGIASIRQRDYVPGAYLEVTAADRPHLPGLEALDWLPLDTPWLECAPAEGAQPFLRYIPVGMYGPPEKCYYSERSDIPGIIAQRSGKGICVTLPWQAGSQYYRFPTHAIPGLFQAVLAGILDLPRSIQVEASPLVEVSAFTIQDGLLLGLVNLSGQNGRAAHDPLPVRDVRFRLPPSFFGAGVESLALGVLPAALLPDGGLEVTLPELELMDMVMVR